MEEPSWMSGVPRKILFATDLSARCDRALDRSALLSAQWKAPLVALHVLEREEVIGSPDLRGLPSWHRPPDPARFAERQLRADLPEGSEPAVMQVEEGDPGDMVLRVAEDRDSDLIIAGIARNEAVGRIILGSTLDHLVRLSRVPVLVVKSRARLPYRNIVVATDFSESSRHAFDAALRFFPDQRFTVFHAYEAPFSGMVSDSKRYRRDYRKVAAEDCAAFLGGIDMPDAVRNSLTFLIEDGAPDDLLRDYVREQNVDLVVLGTHGRSAVFDVLLGSIAKRMLVAVPCDVLIVREPRANARKL